MKRGTETQKKQKAYGETTPGCFEGDRMNLTWMYEMELTAFLHKREGNNEISLVYRWKWFARKGKIGESELKNNSCQTQNQVRSV